MSPPVVLSKQHARCSADLRLLAARSAIEAREEGAGVEGSSACRQSVAAVANKQSASIIQRAHDGEARARAVVALQLSGVKIYESQSGVRRIAPCGSLGNARTDPHVFITLGAGRFATVTSAGFEPRVAMRCTLVNPGPVPSAVVYK